MGDVKHLIDEFSKMPPMVIQTAYIYAINHTLYGEDVTEKWVTATQNANALEKAYREGYDTAMKRVNQSLPTAHQERLTDDDFETIRIHLNAYKEKLCNQHRWKEAEEYQALINRFMAFACLQQEIIRCKDCQHFEHWYADKGRCFLWSEDGIDVFEVGFCNYAKRRNK